MLISLRNAYQMEILSQAGSESLGHVSQAVIDPDKGIVAAFQLDSRPPTYLATVDVAGYADDAIVTKVPDAVQALDDLIRLRPFVENKLKPIGLKAVDEEGKALGKVSDFIFDSTDHRLMRVHVRPSLLRMITAQELIISRDRILKITPSKMVVRYDSSVSEKAGFPVETEPIS